LIQSGKLDLAIAGGADALTAFTLNGFNTLLLLDNELCRPFDANRKGLNLGEGAGYVLLISDKLVKDGVCKSLCKLTGYSNMSDGFHQTALSPNGDGPYSCMSNALKLANLQPENINYINLHGTATPNNDASEGNAIMRLFDNKIPALSSTKSFTGHTLGASGGIEAVFSILALMNNKILPNLRFNKLMTEVAVNPSTSPDSLQINHVLSNSFGFGGNCSSLIFSKN
jgi:3-oxoacyl-(acyl-carrier-protein) synthase